MSDALKKGARKLAQPVPQSQQARSDQVPNDAGGWGFKIDEWNALQRFLILGSDKGTYYTDEEKVTLDSAKSVLACLSADGARAVQQIVSVSVMGHAARNSPAIFALALACIPDYATLETRKLAYEAIPAVCRTGTHLFEFCQYVNTMRGWGRSLRRAVGNWYLSKSENALELQLVKYRQRDGWTHKDVLALAHPKAQNERINNLLSWAVTGVWDDPNAEVPKEYVAPIIGGYMAANAHPEKPQPELVAGLSLPREALPTQWLNDKGVWTALLKNGRGQTMPIGAMLRNLGKMTAMGLFNPLHPVEVATVVDALTDPAVLKNGRLHPFAMLMALKTYAQGHGDKGSLKWDANSEIVDALNAGFYKAFDAVEPTDKRFVVGVDISSSMTSSFCHGSNISAAEASAALLLAFMNVEKLVAPMAYNEDAKHLAVSKNQRLDDATRVIKTMFGGGTDCSAPIRRALETRLETDAFVIFTDSQTWAGMIHPFQAIHEYRQKMNLPDTRCIVVQMCNNKASIVSPATDPLCFECVGLDTTTPVLIRDFVAGVF